MKTGSSLRERLDTGSDPQEILTDCRDGMALVGKRYEAHRWIQSVTAVINAAVVLGIMIQSFVIHILPGIPGKLLVGDYAVTTIHAIVGAAGLLLGIFVVLRANQLVPHSLRFKNYKAFMRTSYVLYMLATLLEKVSTLISANMHSLVDQALKANSIAVIDQYIRQVEDQLENLNDAAATVGGRGETLAVVGQLEAVAHLGPHHPPADHVGHGSTLYPRVRDSAPIFHRPVRSRGRRSAPGARPGAPLPRRTGPARRGARRPGSRDRALRGRSRLSLPRAGWGAHRAQARPAEGDERSVRCLTI